MLMDEEDFDKHFYDSYADFYLTHFTSRQVTKVISVAGLRVKLLFATVQICEKLFPAISHLELTDTPLVDMQLIVFDLASAKSPLTLKEFNQKIYRKLTDDLNLKTIVKLSSHFKSHAEFAYYFNQSKRFGFWLTANVESLNAWHFSNPLKNFFSDWLLRNNKVVVHAAAVADETRAIILVGKSGSGKSTLMMNCFMSGLTVFGDDQCVLDTEVTPPSVHSLYNTVKLDATIIDNFTGASAYILRHMTNVGGVYKSHVDMNKMKPDNLSLSKPVKAIIKLSVNTNLNSPRLSAMSTIDAIKHTALSSISQSIHISPKMVLASVTKAISSTKAYYLELSTNYEKNVEIIREVLKTHECMEKV